MCTLCYSFIQSHNIFHVSCHDAPYLQKENVNLSTELRRKNEDNKDAFVRCWYKIFVFQSAGRCSSVVKSYRATSSLWSKLISRLCSLARDSFTRRKQHLAHVPHMFLLYIISAAVAKSFLSSLGL